MERWARAEGVGELGDMVTIRRPGESAGRGRGKKEVRWEVEVGLGTLDEEEETDKENSPPMPLRFARRASDSEELLGEVKNREALSLGARYGLGAALVRRSSAPDMREVVGRIKGLGIKDAEGMDNGGQGTEHGLRGVGGWVQDGPVRAFEDEDVSMG